MKGIQINNFFNNHISLNPKKNANKQPNLFYQNTRPQPIVFNNNLNQQEPQEAVSYDGLTPQMKAFNKQPALSNRKKRTNTIDQINKNKQNRKSKGKKSNSYQKFRKTVSMDKYNQKDTSQQHDVSKTLNKHYKKPKTSKNKPEYQSQGVKRSKSAIIKHTHSKAIDSHRQISKQFNKDNTKKNIISADISLKDVTKKQIKKQTQNLINKKQQTQRVQCKTARVQSKKTKPRKNKDKIIGELQKSVEKQDKKYFKFNTDKKPTGVTASKSYLTSAKQSKPMSARQKKSSKKLFDSKQKQDQSHFYRKLQDFIKDEGEQQNSQVKQALSELQQVLQGMSSKKNLAKQLKKLTFKLKNIPSKNNSQQENSQSEQEESNSQAFKRIKDFKNNLVKKKLNEAKMAEQQKQTYREQGVSSRQQGISSSKKSSKKLLKNKKKLQDPQKNTKKAIKIQNMNDNNGRMMQDSNPSNKTSQPQVFKNTQQQQSKYIMSRNVSQFIEQRQQQINFQLPKQAYHDQQQVLDQSNKKYMQFLRNLQSQKNYKQQTQHKHQHKDQYKDQQQKNDHLIQDINNYLNKQYIINKEYNSEKIKQNLNNKNNNVNPILQRRKAQGYPIQNIQKDHALKNYLSDNQQSNQNIQVEESDQDQLYNFNNNYNKKSQIEALKSFQKQSDQMMNKAKVNISNQKKKNLTIQLNENNNIQNKSQQTSKTTTKTPSSPKYDDHYPQLIKSPKLSDIQITNILSIKEKCLQSKNKKMNQLIKKMYQKQLVSPKSYEYYMYQIKKQYEEQTQSIDGFKQQASQILNQINKQKNDIKIIDQLIRQQKWQQARKLMKNDHKAASVLFGFKKNKQKIYQTYNSNQIQTNKSVQDQNLNNKKQQVQVSPSKRFNIGVIQNNINITIKPQIPVKPIKEQPSKKQQLNKKQQNNSTNNKIQLPKQQYKPLSNQTNKVNQTKKQKGGLIRQQRKISYSSSQSQQYQNQQTITKRLDFQFQSKYHLKSNQDFNTNLITKDKLQSQFNSYLNVEKADSQDFEHYVYYQSQQAEQNNNTAQNPNQQSNRLRPQGIFKLFEVQKTHDYQQNQNQKSDSQSGINKQSLNINLNKNTKRVIQIDQGQTHYQHSLQQCRQKLITVPNLQAAARSQEQQKDDDNLSDSNSILQLELRKGFQSNLFFIKEYCISLCQYIRDNPQIKNQFKNNISQPLQFTTEQLLKKFRKQTDGTYNNQYNSAVTPLQYKTQFRKPPNKAISSQLAKQFNKSYGPLKFWNKDLSKKGRQKFNMEKQAQAIFLSAILQVLNESLDFERPGSIFGKPLAWANNSKHLKNMKYLNGQKTKKVSEDSQESAQTYDFIFGVAIARIIQWGSCLCGFLPDTAQLQNTQIDDDYVVHIRQTRMAFLLQKMLAEQEATFNNSELQQTQIMLYLGKAIAQQLINEVSQQIANTSFYLSQNSFNEN